MRFKTNRFFHAKCHVSKISLSFDFFGRVFIYFLLNLSLFISTIILKDSSLVDLTKYALLKIGLCSIESTQP